MNDENDGWTDDLEAYVQAYADEERRGIDAVVALSRFSDGRLAALVPLKERSGRRRAAAFAMVGAALAAGLAGIWISNGRSFRREVDDDSATLTQDAADPATQTRAFVPVDPQPPKTTRLVNPRRPEVPPSDPEPEAVHLDEPPLKLAPAAPSPRPHRSNPNPGREVPSSSEPSEFARELVMLSSLRKSARARDYANTLKLVRAYRVQFPKPTLAAERDLIELEALCGLGRVSQTSDAKEAFAKAHPTHHLKAKAEHVCEKNPDHMQNGDSLRHQGE